MQLMQMKVKQERIAVLGLLGLGARLNELTEQLSLRNGHQTIAVFSSSLSFIASFIDASNLASLQCRDQLPFDPEITTVLGVS